MNNQTVCAGKVAVKWEQPHVADTATSSLQRNAAEGKFQILPFRGPMDVTGILYLRTWYDSNPPRHGSCI